MQPTFYIIYRTTNNVNGKIYIGKHQTSNLDDGYIGSGKLLKRAINKYGVENFIKEVLHIFDNEADMNEKEKELVTEEFVLLETNYNLCVGGQGGFSYINRTPKTKEHKRKISEKLKNHKHTNHSLEAKEHRSKLAIERRKITNKKGYQPPSFTGKAHTEETKAKMSGPRIASAGKNNSQFGTMWITNGTISKKINKNDIIPDGWKKGRKVITGDASKARGS